MSKKQIFIWSIIAGIAISGGVSGVANLIIWIAVLWVLNKVCEAVEAFCSGWKSSVIERESAPKQRPVLRVIKGGA